jgi:predicted AlkP superfamily pyrophosphatase or phosphodiesterase
MKASIFVLIDALGWEWIKEHPFLKEVAPYRRPLDSVLGFSTAAIPSILTGRFPQEHGRLSLFHRANGHSPFSKLKLICAMPPWMVENRYARFGVKTLARRMNNLTGYFQLYGVPLKHLPRLDICEKRNIYAPGGIPGSTSIFDLLHRDGKSYRTYCYHDGTDDQLLAAIEADLRAGAAKFYFLYLAGLDYFLHAHADDREAAAEMLSKYSSAIARLHKIALETYGAADIHVFGDHGMAPTVATIDIQARLTALHIKASVDYLCLLDSTMARFWFFNARARDLVSAALSEVDGGRWLDADDLVNLHSWFPDGKYGEKIFLTESGTVIAPCHMGAKAPAGMHGFLPSAPHSRSAFVSSIDHGDSINQITDLFGVMKAHA